MKRILLVATILFTIKLAIALSCAIADDGTPVPEPSTLLLLGFAIAGLGFVLFWKSKKKKSVD